MTRPLSLDLRERVVASVLAGKSCRSVAERFDVAVSSVVKWSQRQRATGSVLPGKMGGHRKPVLDPHRAFIVERITQTPHLTLHGLKAELAALQRDICGTALPGKCFRQTFHPAGTVRSYVRPFSAVIDRWP